MSYTCLTDFAHSQRVTKVWRNVFPVVHAISLCFWGVGVTPNIFHFWWITWKKSVHDVHTNQGSQCSSVPTYTLVVHNVALYWLGGAHDDFSCSLSATTQMVHNVMLSVCMFVHIFHNILSLTRQHETWEQRSSQKQSAFPSWQCNTSENPHQPAMLLEEKCMEWVSCATRECVVPWPRTLQPYCYRCC